MSRAMTIAHFLAVALTGLAMVPGGAHVLEATAKLSLDESAYFTVQQIYRGWAWTGAVIFAALGANVWVAVLRRAERSAAALAIAAALLIVLALAIFFAWTYPANQVTANWTAVPAGWAAWRAQWEYSHLAGAATMVGAFFCAIGSALVRRA